MVPSLRMDLIRSLLSAMIICTEYWSGWNVDHGFQLRFAMLTPYTMYIYIAQALRVALIYICIYIYKPTFIRRFLGNYLAQNPCRHRSLDMKMVELPSGTHCWGVWLRIGRQVNTWYECVCRLSAQESQIGSSKCRGYSSDATSR